uniref:Uncharacterized protein n=1 Tax=Oryza nivara TaxID=4536 RepID=A0A0E0FUF3_ORYNI
MNKLAAQRIHSSMRLLEIGVLCGALSAAEGDEPARQPKENREAGGSGTRGADPSPHLLFLANTTSPPNQTNTTFPHPCYSRIRNPHPKILATSAPRVLAAGQRYHLAVQAAIALSPYLPATQRRFVVVELAAPQLSPGAIVLHHLPADTVPAAAVVFSWIHRPTPSPTISSTAISSLLMAAARRLLHTSPIRCFFHSMRYTCEIISLLS